CRQKLLHEIHDLDVAHLREVEIERADRVESFGRRVQDNNVISQRLQLLHGFVWRDRNGNDNFGRILVTRLMNREGHRQAGWQPVIYNDRDTSLCRYWRTPS